MGARITLPIGLMIAAAALVAYDRQKIDPEAYALDPATVLTAEAWDNVPFTAPYIPLIREMVAAQREHPPAGDPPCRPAFILWLGNSQLHFINQFRKGEHVAPYWLRRSLPCPDSTVPLGVSLAGANLQEHYVLTQYVERRLPISAIVLALSFNDLREDGLRDGFSDLLDEQDRARLNRTEVGAAILADAQALWQGRDRADENSGIEGSLQWRLETALDSALAQRWPLWADRPHLRLVLTADLYRIRNIALRIKSTTLRRMLPQRYERNMQALESLLQEAHANAIPLVAYVIPIRPDFAMPYDPSEYAAWKQQLARMTAASGATLLDLDALVPAADWEPPSAYGEVDFNHVDAKAHELLAAALLPHIQALLESRR